jgi:hypothetical protein
VTRDATRQKLGLDGVAHGLHAPRAAKLGDEAPARSQRARHAFRHGVGPRHPMQGGVGKHAVELLLEAQLLPVTHGKAQARMLASCLVHHLGRSIQPTDVRPALGQLRRQISRTAAQVEHTLTRLRRQEIDQVRAQLGHERARAVVVGRIPGLLSDGVHGLKLRSPSHSVQ